MAARMLKPKSAWKPVHLGLDFGDNPLLEGLSSIEVLEDYYLPDSKAGKKGSTSACAVPSNLQQKSRPYNATDSGAIPKAKRLHRSAKPLGPCTKLQTVKKAKCSVARKDAQNKHLTKVTSPDASCNATAEVDTACAYGAELVAHASNRAESNNKATVRKRKLSTVKHVLKEANGVSDAFLVQGRDVQVSEQDADKVMAAEETLQPDLSAWKDLFIPEQVLRSLGEQGFISPTLIQALAIPAAIRDRQDILGAAETGSGKTLAFAIPVLDRIIKLKEEARESAEDSTIGVFALILTPTRELCKQVYDHIRAAAKYTDIKAVAIFGGLSTQKQSRLLSYKPEIIVATPGRLWDIMEEGNNHLKTIPKAPLLVIDEADRMVEKGHFEELTKILLVMRRDQEASSKRQTFIFSATLTFVHSAPERLKTHKKKRKLILTKDDKINSLIKTVGILKKPKVIDITKESQTAETLTESYIVCAQNEKDLHLYYFLKRYPGRTLIFTNSIDCIRRLVALFALLKLELLPLHASMHQKQRLKNLERFSAKSDSVLIATDVAARGLDIPDVEHVIHYQVPRTSESYVHRSGRTARAHKDGLSVLIVDEKDLRNFKSILRTLHKEKELVQFPVDLTVRKRLEPMVSLAQEIDKVHHHSVKEQRNDDWFVKMAKEADLDLSEDEVDQDDTLVRKKSSEKRNIAAMKAQLATLLLSGETTNGQFRGRYPTCTGKLQLVKQTNAHAGPARLLVKKKKL